MSAASVVTRWTVVLAIALAPTRLLSFITPPCLSLVPTRNVRKPAQSGGFNPTRMSDQTEDRPSAQTIDENRGGDAAASNTPSRKNRLLLTKPMDVIRVSNGKDPNADREDGQRVRWQDLGRENPREGEHRGSFPGGRGGPGRGTFGRGREAGNGQLEQLTGRENFQERGRSVAPGRGRPEDNRVGSGGSRAGRGEGARVREADDSVIDEDVDELSTSSFPDRRSGFNLDKRKIAGGRTAYEEKGLERAKKETARRDRRQRMRIADLNEDDEEEEGRALDFDEDFTADDATAERGEVSGAVKKPSKSGRKATPSPKRGSAPGRTTFRDKMKKKENMRRAQQIVRGPALVKLTEPVITVTELASQMQVKPAEVVKHLMFNMGVMVTVTQSIDAETARQVADGFGVEVSEDVSPSGELTAGAMSPDGKGAIMDEDAEDTLLPRSPVVTIMGHVDHGKTSLLDAIRETKVVAGEAGGITQHVSAYQVQTEEGRDVTFVDTPGHAAFRDMRSRGANATDLVVLVVAADDGVKDQTKECIATARMAQVPIVVAINKVDKPTADIDKVQNELMSYDLLPEEFGGETQVAKVSAVQKTGLNELLEKILLQADVLELKANPNRPAHGVVIEAQMEKGMGTVSTVLIQHGTLRVGDIFIAGESSGKVRTLMDHTGERIQEAGPSVPTQVGGFDGVPDAGDAFMVIDREDMARKLAEARRKIAREVTSAKRQAGLKSSGEAILTAQAGDTKEAFELNVLVKADVQGSEQALETALSDLKSEDDYFTARCRLLSTGVGPITKSDIAVAGVSNAYVVGFNVGAEFEATKEARANGIEIGYYGVVYDVLDDIQKRLDELVSPTPDGVYAGRALVKVIFNIGKVGNIAGCFVEDGSAVKGGNVLVKRLGRIVHEGQLKTLKNVKADVDEMAAGSECGIQVEGYEDFQEGDIIECYKPE